MQCALCHKDSKLCLSHIFPEHLYKESLYDENHKFHRVSDEDDKNRPRAFQKGLREHLLCVKCEQQLSVYETYAAEILFGGPELLFEKFGEYLTLSNLDYPKLKLYQLSLIWRASVSRNPDFHAVNLGKHGEIIRQMILQSNPGSSDLYGSLMFVVKDGDDLASGFFLPPVATRLDGHIAYWYVIGGVAFVHVVTSSPIRRVISDFFAQSEGTAIVKVQQLAEIGVLRRRIAKFNEEGRFDTLFKDK